MLNLQPLTAFRGSPFSLLPNPQTSGFCYHCERISHWEDLSLRYRCSHCGSDPVEEAEGAEGPVSLVGEHPVAPSASAAPRRRWTGRFPTRRIPSDFWPTLGARASVSR